MEPPYDDSINGEDEDTEDSNELTAEEDEEPSTANAASKGKKKKKKKKKKKSTDTGQSAAPVESSSGPNANKVDKNEAERRFNEAVKTARSSDRDIWIKLSSCNIFDGKTKKLMDALKSNNSVTSLDLSINHIGDEGAQAIASVLGMQGAPELIELDLRENCFTEQGLTVLDGLRKIRKQLQVLTGPIKPSEPDPAPEKGLGKDITKGPMFRKYFQTGDDDDEAAAASQEAQLAETFTPPEELWPKLQQLVEAGEPSVPELTATLQHLCLALQREMSLMQSSGGGDPMDGSRPQIKACLMHLGVLEDVLLLTPREVVTQHSSIPLPAVGTHRVWAAEVVALLLSLGDDVIGRLLAATKLVPRVLHLALTHQLCSALHTKALRILGHCTSSRVPELLQPLFQPGFGSSLQQPKMQEPCKPLHQQLIYHCCEAVNLPSGLRSPLIGFAIEMCQVLQLAYDEMHEAHNPDVRQALQADSSWREFIAEQGTLNRLLEERDGELCGPRPVRPIMDATSSELAELAGGGLMGGPEILALLQGMSAMGVMS